MSYKKNDKSILPAVKNIISLNQEVLVEHYFKHCAEYYYFIRSIDELENLLNKTTDKDFVTIYKKKQLPYRGVLNSEFKEKVLSEYRNINYDFVNHDYAIYEYVFYPKYLKLCGAGSSLSDLSQDLKELLEDFGGDNKHLCFGIHPSSLPSKIHLTEDDEVIVISGEYA